MLAFSDPCSHRGNGSRAAATSSSSYPDRYPGPSASSSHRHGTAPSSYSRRSPSPTRGSSSRRERDRTDRDRDYRDRHSSSYRERSPGSPRHPGQSSRLGKGSYAGTPSGGGYYGSGSRRGRSPSRSPRSRSRSRSRSPPAHPRSKDGAIHRPTPIRPGDYSTKAASSSAVVTHAGPPLSYRRRRASSGSSDEDSPRVARSERKERRTSRARSVSRSPRSPTSSSDSNDGTGTRRTRPRRRDGDEASLKRPRSPTRDGKERYGNGAGIYVGSDAASKKAKTESLEYRRESYPPLPTQNGIVPSTYPPLAPVIPTGPRAFAGYTDPLYPLAGTGVYPAPPLDAPLSYPHPNALPTAPGSSGIKVQITTSTSARPATTGPGGRPGFVPIGAARDTPAAPLKTAPASDVASTVTPSSKSHTAGGDIKRFFPGDDDESSGPSRPASRVEGENLETRASYTRKEERRSYDRVDRMDVDDRDRPSRDSERNRDRAYGRDRERDLDRSDRDGDSRGGWITRGAGDVPPARGARASEVDSPAARPPPPRFQPAVRNGPAAPAGTLLQSNGTEKSSYEKRASYERPPTATKTGVVTSANSVAPVAQRRWGAPPSAEERKTEAPAVDPVPTPAELAGGDAPRSTSTSAETSTAATPSGPPEPPAAAVVPAPSQVEEAARPAPPAPTELYERLVQVGEGTYGKVYKARNVETGGLVALKRIRMEAERDGFPVTAVREIKLLQSLRHPNVVELVEMLVAKGEDVRIDTKSGRLLTFAVRTQAKSTWFSNTSITT